MPSVSLPLSHHPIHMLKTQNDNLMPTLTVRLLVFSPISQSLISLTTSSGLGNTESFHIGGYQTFPLTISLTYGIRY